MWALHTCGWKMLPWWLLWPEHSSEVRSGSIHRDNKIGRGEVKVEEVEIIALFQERNMRKLQSIHSYRQMASCPWRKKKNQLCLSGKIYTVKYSLSSSNKWGQGRKNNTLIFFSLQKGKNVNGWCRYSFELLPQAQGPAAYLSDEVSFTLPMSPIPFPQFWDYWHSGPV